jgi:hypothetical protein
MENENFNRALARGYCACEPPAKIYIFNAIKTNWRELKIKYKFCDEHIKFCRLENDMVVDFASNASTFNRKQ